MPKTSHSTSAASRRQPSNTRTLEPRHLTPGRYRPTHQILLGSGAVPARAKEPHMSDDNSDGNITALPPTQPQPNWTRKINIPLPVLPEHVRRRLRTPGYWTAMLAISAFGAAYTSGRLPNTRDVLVALVLTGFVVFLSAVGMVCQAIKDTRTTATGQQASGSETTPARRIAA